MPLHLQWCCKYRCFSQSNGVGIDNLVYFNVMKASIRRWFIGKLTVESLLMNGNKAKGFCHSVSLM